MKVPVDLLLVNASMACTDDMQKKGTKKLS